MSHDRDERSSNPSYNRQFADVVAARWSRRDMLRGGLGAAAVGFFAGPAVLEGMAHAGSVFGTASGRRQALGFTAVPPSSSDAIVVAPEYTAEVLIPWGTPLRSDGPAWLKDASNTAAEQARQVGMHHDGMHYFPLERGPGGSRHGLLVLNHEYVDRTILYQDGDAVMTEEKVAKALAAHGVTVIEISSESGTWRQVDSPYNRRITGTTPVTFSGPVAADHPMLQANDPPAGTLNNCAYGHTPWRTYLACEENFDGYFGTADTTFVSRPDELRYGVDRSDSGFRWFTKDPRFDVAENRNEPNRFGWVVEIDPFDPQSTPVKRTALGRIKHEGALVTESRGRVVVYMGDDQDGDYMYKFVGARTWRSVWARGRSPLDEGTLYVARFNDDGTGDWLPLVHGQGPLTSANGFADQADVLLRTRQAADAVGPTKMDRPEWIAENPHDGSLYVSLTNSTSGANAANPRAVNPYGHILRWHEERGDNTRTRFRWDIFVLAGDPQYDPQVTLSEDDIFGSPDGLWFDDDGRLWIQTDISNSSQNRADRGYDRIGNNQLLVADTETGEIRRFLTGPRGCEITGIIATPDQRTLFVNVQHPGEATDFWGTPTPANPRAVSNWPDFDPDGRPRAATVVIRRHDGGKIGT